jgi:peptide/nickel transport system substrate-binding protein
MDPQSKSRLSRRSLVASAGGASALAVAGAHTAAAAPADSNAPVRAQFQDANIPTPREQTVVINQGTNNVWDSFNPFIPNGEAYNYGLAIVCREYMFYSNFLTGEIRPWLATEYTYNEDFTQCTLTLNPNVTWNDGEPFTSEDIVFTQTLLLENPQLNGAAGVIRDVASVSATDPQTVVWELTSANSRFHYRFIAGIIADGLRVVPKHIWEGEDPGTFKFNPPVQTGPYVLQEASSTQLYYVWEKNPNYWNKAELDPAPQYAIWRQATEVDTMVQEFLAGATDVPGIDYLNQQVVAGQYDQTASFDFPDPCTRGFFFNTDSASGLFATPEGRWALSHLIDREVIATTIWQPPTRPATYPWADYEGWQTWAPDEVMSQFDLTFNVDKANELLDALGATERDGDTRMLNGKALRLTMITPAQTTGLEYQIGASFANTAKEAGIDIELKSLPGSAWGDAFYTGQYDISCHWICGMQFDPNQLYNNFHSRNYKPVGERTESIDGAATRLQSPELDALVVELDTIDVEAEASKTVFNDALTTFMTELPAVPSIQTTYPMFFNTRYWTGWPSADDPYTIPANWWGQFMFVIGTIQPTGES